MNREQFTYAVRQELPNLRRFLLAACSGNRDEADDIAQEALLKAYTASANFGDEAGFSAWIYRIACNCMTDHLRKASVRGNVLDIARAYDVAATSHSDDTFDYQELYHAIDGLTLGERTAVLLFYMEDRSIREISIIMNVAEGTVKANLSRGREHLREKLRMKSE